MRAIVRDAQKAPKRLDGFNRQAPDADNYDEARVGAAAGSAAGAS